MFWKDMLKSSAELFCSNFHLYVFFDLLMGDSRTPHFYDFGIFEHVLPSQNRYFIFWDTMIPQIIQENPEAFQQILFI